MRAARAVAAAAAAVTVTVAGCAAESAPPPSSQASSGAATTLTVSVGSTPSPRVDASLNGPLHDAAAANDTRRVKELLDRGAELENRGFQGRTPLVTATKNRAVDAARVLIDAGADVNAKDDIEDSAYLYAGAEGYDAILRMTLEHGADLRSVNRFGGTALIPAAEHGSVSTVRILIKAGVDVDHVNTPVWTALQEAVVYGDGSQKYQDVVGALLVAGADPNIRDAQGRTALTNALGRGQSAIVALLRGHGGTR